MASTQNSEVLAAFLDGFSEFIRIDFSCKQIDEEHPHEIIEALHQEIPTLCKNITRKSGHGEENDDDQVTAQLWPTILTTCEADAVISRDAHQDRGTLIVGLQGELDRDEIVKALRAWTVDMRTTTLFIDYIPPPSLATLLVRREELGRLVVDSWTMPELLQDPFIVFTPTSTYHEALQLSQSAPSKSRGGNAVAAATAHRSPSPSSKRLTPASAILNRLKWDGAFDSKDFIVVYEDRHAGLMESPVESWITESTEETFVPMHRVRAVKKKSTGMVMWHREERIDLISGN